MKTLAIDPGNIESAFVIWDGEIIYSKGKLKNEDLLSTNLATKKGYCTQRLIIWNGWDSELLTYPTPQN